MAGGRWTWLCLLSLLTACGTDTAALGVASAVLDVTALNFPAATVGTIGTLGTVTLTNRGGQPLGLSAYALNDTSDFAMTTTCGPTLSAGAQCSFNLQFQPQTVREITGSLTVTDNSGGDSGAQQVVTLSGTGLPVPLAEAVLTPAAALSFAPTIKNSSAVPQTVTLSNSGTAPLLLGAVVLADTADYGLTSTCRATLAPGAACTLAVTFHPVGTGPLPSTLSLTDNSGLATGTVQQTIALSGTGLPVPLPQASLAPLTAGFGTVQIGTATAAQTFTLTNTGTGALTIASVAVNDLADYSLTSSCGTTLAVGASCSVAVTFQPTRAGALDATVTVTDNSGGNAGTQQVISLSGTGVPVLQALAVFTPSSLAFPDTMLTMVSAAEAIQLSNTGNAPLSLNAVALSDTANFSLASTCAATLAPSASCTFSVVFQPQAITGYHATLTLTDNSGLTGPNSSSGATVQQTIPIAGNGIAFSGPRAVVSPATLTFAKTVTNSSAASQSVTLSNTGTTNLTVSGVALSGPAAAAFVLSQGTCAGPLAPGASCTETVTYSPRLASAADTASLVFTDNSLNQAGSTQTAVLMGSAIAEVDSVANFGDSITCGYYAQPNDGTGLVYSLEGYAGLFDTYLGVPAGNFCRKGDTAADLSRLWVPFRSAPTSTGNQLYTLMIGTNDAYRYGIPQSSLETYSQEVSAALSWLAIPNTDKVLANAVTQQTGTWVPDVGFGLQSTDAAASLTFHVNEAAAGRNLYLVYHVWALPYGEAGKATISVDGILGATVDESQASLVNIPTENGTADTFLVETVPLGAVGPHTVTFASAGPAGSVVGLLWAGTPQADYHTVDGAPRVLVGLITNSPSGNQTYAADIYNLQLKSLVPALAADGMNLTLVPTDRVMDPATDFADILHPNNAGHAKLANAFEQYR